MEKHDEFDDIVMDRADTLGNLVMLMIYLVIIAMGFGGAYRAFMWVVSL